MFAHVILTFVGLVPVRLLGPFVAIIAGVGACAEDAAAPPQERIVFQGIPLRTASDGFEGRLEVFVDARFSLQHLERFHHDARLTQLLDAKLEYPEPFRTQEPINAELQLRDVDGNLVDTAPLAKPVATLGKEKLYGSARETIMVKVDHGGIMGSYNGPITSLAEVVKGRISFLEAHDLASGKREPIRLSEFLKVGWKLVPASRGKGKVILLAVCQFDSERNKAEQRRAEDPPPFAVEYSRFFFRKGEWVKVSRKVPGWFENEGDGTFPKRELFP